MTTFPRLKSLATFPRLESEATFPALGVRSNFSHASSQWQLFLHLESVATFPLRGVRIKFFRAWSRKQLIPRFESVATTPTVESGKGFTRSELVATFPALGISKQLFLRLESVAIISALGVSSNPLPLTPCHLSGLDLDFHPHLGELSEYRLVSYSL